MSVPTLQAPLPGETAQVLPTLTGPTAENQDTDAPPVTRRGATQMGVAGLLSSAGAGWMCAAIFHGAFPHVVALIGALIGAGVVAFSYRTRRPNFVQCLVVPITVLTGAVLLIPYTGHGQSLPGLISASVKLGGLEFAPVPFNPGWHFLLLLLIALVAATAVALAAGLGKPRLATFVPLPLLFAASLIQPHHGGFVSTGVGLALVVASLAVSYGVELAGQDSTTTQFELRRLVKAGAMMLGLGLALVLIAQAGFLFPPVKPGNVIPPRHPSLPPPVPDTPMFSVLSPEPLTYRVGVLDGYAQNGWETAPYDPSQLQTLPASGRIPVTPGVPVAPAAGSAQAPAPVHVTFTIRTLKGDVVPDLALPEAVTAPPGQHLLYYPRTQILQLAGTAQPGLSYTEVAAGPPSAKQLEAAAAAPAALDAFLVAPPAPASIAALIARAPTSDAFDRVQYLRTALYKAVVAKGNGTPADVPPALVAAMLAGHTANPYQIVGAEALLARWAGVPARIGYGYYTPSVSKTGSYVIYPTDGASWLEIYLGGLGWVPLVGQPLHAEASLGQHKPNPTITPSQQLALTVYLFYQQPNNQQLYVLVRYWAEVLAPYLALALLSWAFWPVPVKAGRRLARARWARRAGPLGRIVVAYAEFRDAAADLRVGEGGLSPLAFLEVIESDDEHAELAWLLTRGLWGDLQRDLRPADADAAVAMARSVTKRLRRAQPASARVAAAAARTSLRAPFTRDVPACWPEHRVKTRAPKRSPQRRGLGARLRRLRPGVAAALLLLMVLAGCGRTNIAAGLPPGGGLPGRITPAKLRIGPLTFAVHREVAAESAFTEAGPSSVVLAGRVYTVRLHTSVQASLQVGAFKAGIHAGQPAVQADLLANLGSGRFQQVSLAGPGGPWTIWRGSLPSQVLYVYFAPSGAYYDLLVAQQAFADATPVLASVLGYQGSGHVPT
ncbi:MAG: transglutaminase-like domain-containing protein [Mycobacteriales bacterium]